MHSFPCACFLRFFFSLWHLCNSSGAEQFHSPSWPMHTSPMSGITCRCYSNDQTAEIPDPLGNGGRTCKTRAVITSSILYATFN
ncbi:hypothetical protein V8C42DRAFT_304105 [Trichoderma barbatum]